MGRFIQYVSATPRAVDVFKEIVEQSYLGAASLAFIKYPLTYDPTRNWLSDLGNAGNNPNGAWLYNAGVLATGALLVPFFLGLSKLELAGRRSQIVMVVMTQVFGLVGAVSMMMSAVFPIDQSSLHSLWSAGLYGLLGTAFAFSVAALRYEAKHPRWLMGLGVLAALSALGMAVFQTMPAMEWMTVAVFLSYAALLG